MQQRVVETARPDACRSFVGAFAIATLLPMAAMAAADPAEHAGAWTLSRDDASKTCQVNLRTSASGTGWTASMPSGCRRAIPALKAVRAWSMPRDGAISLDDDSGASTLLFEDAGNGNFHATAPDGSGLTLAASEAAVAPSVVDLNVQDGAGRAAIVTLDPSKSPASPSAAGAPSVVQLAKAAPQLAKIVSASDVAGQYAVMRGDRDTGCMVTLDSSAHGPKTSLKAHLAPACRDQGIIIFDPIGWQMNGPRLVLTARKGHTLHLEKSEAGIWAKDPNDWKTIGLKHL